MIMRVEIFTSTNEFNLESMINSHLETVSLDDVIDIKYAATHYCGNYEYSAMIIFKN